MTTTTIERTGKKWKGLHLAGVALMLGSGIGFVLASLQGWLVLLGASGIGFVLGLGLYVVARAGAWWFHG